MALRFMDSHTHFTTYVQKYEEVQNGVSGPITTGASGDPCNRFTGQKGMDSWNTQRWVRKTIDAQQTWIVGFAWKPYGAAPVANTMLMGLMDTASWQTWLSWQPGNYIQFFKSTTPLGSPVLLPNFFQRRWYYVEVKIKIHGSTGTCDVRFDGTSVISLSGQNTQNTGNATADRIAWGDNYGNNAVGADWCDFYVCDTSGGAPTNDFLGDVRCEALYPSGNGNSSQWVGNDADSTDNYLLVDESQNNDDTDYVESGTVGNKDTYAMTNLTSTTGTVYGVQPIPRAKKTDAGARSICSVARLAATEVDSANFALNTAYVTFSDIREAKPGGGVWTITDVNSAEFGMKVTV